MSTATQPTKFASTDEHGLFRLAQAASREIADPVEGLDFAIPLADNSRRFDTRSDAQLATAAFESPAPVERERAIWEFADRSPDAALSVVAEFAHKEKLRPLRSGALWLLQRTAKNSAVTLLADFLNDPDPEVADWSRTLTEEFSGTQVGGSYSKLMAVETGAFDQTLPLFIAGHILIAIPGMGSIKVTMSPLWFESIMGRVMACTNANTVMEDLVIEKCLSGLHPDQSDHYEIFKFKGLSNQISDRFYQHQYESLMMRRFYPSLHVEQGVSISVPVSLQRVAVTEFDSASNYQVLDIGPRSARLRSSSFVHCARALSRLGRSQFAELYKNRYDKRGRRTIIKSHGPVSRPSHKRKALRHIPREDFRL